MMKVMVMVKMKQMDDSSSLVCDDGGGEGVKEMSYAWVKERILHYYYYCC